jgi:hypothetical protein
MKFHIRLLTCYFKKIFSQKEKKKEGKINNWSRQFGYLIGGSRTLALWVCMRSFDDDN